MNPELFAEVDRYIGELLEIKKKKLNFSFND